MVDRIHDWHEYFFALAQTVKRKSKDRSTQCGCVVIGPDKEVRAIGYNGFPRGWPDDRSEDCDDRDRKYPLTIHAEANAIANAARTGTSLKGCVLYVTAPPCAVCAGYIIQSGISEVRYLRANTDFSSRWKETCDLGLEMFETVGIKTVEHV